MQKKSLGNKHTLTIPTKSDQSTKTRRRLLLGLGGVTATAYLPSQWQKPLIDSIVVPAHAQATGPAQGETTTTTTTQEPLPTVFSEENIDIQPRAIFTPKRTKEPWYAKTLSLVSADANAGIFSPPSFQGKLRILVSEDHSSIFGVTFAHRSKINAVYTFFGDVGLNEAIELSSKCPRGGDSHSIEVLSINGNELQYNASFGSGTAIAGNINIDIECTTISTL